MTKVIESRMAGERENGNGIVRNELVRNRIVRNRIEISVKGLILAVVVIIALVLSAISLYMVTRSKGTINDGNTQYSQLMSDYSEINATLYDGLYVSGDKVIDVIEDCAGTLSEGVVVITLESETPGAAGTTKTYKAANAYKEAALSRNAAAYINPSGTFVGMVSKNANGMVTKITFTQTN